jgi:transposase-like protein
MTPPPTERHRAMAARRKEGAAFSAIAREFGATYESVRRQIGEVERYDRGMEILRDNPASIEGLALIRKLHTLAAKSLHDRGYRTLHDLNSLTLIDLLVMPNVSRIEAEMLVSLAAEARSAVNRGGSGGE